MSRTLQRLASYLEGQQQDILQRWIRRSRGDRASPLISRLTRTEFENNVPQALAGLTLALRQETVQAASSVIREEVAKHGHHRWKQGFNLQELTRDWGALNGVLIEVMQEFFDAQPRAGNGQPAEALRVLAEFMTEAMSASVRRFDELRRAEAAAMQRDLEVLRDEFERTTRERGQLLREAVHDLRGGLSRIAMTSALVRLKQDDSESVEGLTERLERSVASVKEMINGLLDLARLESGAEAPAPEPVALGALLQKIAEEHQPMAQQKGLALRTRGPAGARVETDPQKLERIVQNLLVNALSYTAVGHVEMAWRLEDQRWLLTVRDTGSGMQDRRGSALAEQLDAPERAHAPPGESEGFVGEGIGLTIVKRLCDMLDAGISLESSRGEGTRVTVTFPLDYVVRT